jgi:4a-hydroxytetrahydrobiopterin dehydratase
MAKLSRDQIAENLKSLPGWEYKDDANAITKLFRVKEFMDGIELVNRVAKRAQAADHHPDITINYTRLRFSCSTHDQGGVTEKDIKLATEIEKEFKSLGG